MKPLIAANWKMNKDIKEADSFIKNFKNHIKNTKDTEIVICAPFTLLSELKRLLNKSNIILGAQNMHFEKEGAFTGEVSASMLKDIGCEYVILGHSERRQYFNETDELINKKIKAALKNNLKPILCIGETLDQRDNNETLKVIERQLTSCLEGIDEVKNVAIAYEPIWAIGTGKTATPSQAEEIHKFIRELLTNVYNENISQKTRIIYGGSMKPENAKELLSMPNINGGLVGGASLDAKSFGEICGMS
jgi:triosephosphate isomerase